jgi:uncharacterized protein YfaP (DUF2135 family)
LSSPAEGAKIAALSVTVSGTAQDANPLVVTVNGAPVTVAADESFAAIVPLTPGANTIAVMATDAAGNVTTVSRDLRANTTPPTLALAAPPDGLITNALSVHVTGTASPADPQDTVTVTANGVPATVAPDGSFAAIVPLTPGANTITVVATDGYGLQSMQTATVIQDAVPPVISISGVSDGQSSNTPLTPVFSATDDNLASVSATLDGAPFASGTPVAAAGAHILVVTAADLAGNQSSATVHFTLDATAPIS